jgi:1-acyl-sn-glycerol-3-phosphate acyltransferase
MSEPAPARGPSRAFVQGLFFDFCKSCCALVGTVFYRQRRFDAWRVPAAGPCVIAANHQSFLDPPLIGSALPHRRTHYLARAGLFKGSVFSWLLEAVNSIPIKESSGDLAAIREVVARLERGGAVVLFPEGSRSEDGRMGEFKRGVALIIKKARCPVVPAAIEGAFDAWPRSRLLPRLWGHRVMVRFGDPIPPDEFFKDGVDAGLRRLEREVESMRAALRAEIEASRARRRPRADLDGDEPIGC